MNEWMDEFIDSLKKEKKMKKKKMKKINLNPKPRKMIFHPHSHLHSHPHPNSHLHFSIYLIPNSKTQNSKIKSMIERWEEEEGRMG